MASRKSSEAIADNEIIIKCKTADRILWREITPLQGNYKKRSKEDIIKITKSIKEYGFAFPMFVSRIGKKIYALDGHGRLAGLEALEDEGFIIPPIPVNYVEAKNIEEAKQLLLRCDSRYGSIDKQGFIEFIENLDIDLSDLSLPNIDLSNIKIGEETKGDDDVPEIKKKAISQYGEIYELGNSLLMCGDSAVSEIYCRLLGQEKADLLFTDPPYGVSIGNKNKMLNEHGKQFKRITENIANDTLPEKELYDMLLKAFRIAKDNSKSGASYYVCAPQGGGLGMMMMMMMRDSGLPSRHNLIWEKSSPTFSMGRLDYDYRHEPIIYGWLGSHKFHGNGKFKNSVWNIPKPQACKLHPTMKPVELVENAILNSSKEGDIVLDIFGGSGTTLIASEKNNRKCRMIELDPHYVDVIRRRWTKWAKENNREVGSGGLE